MAARASGLCVALLSVALSTAARASDLSWSGPAECSEREQLLFQIERALGATLAESAPFHFQVHVERTLPDVRARLLVRGDREGSSVKERLLVAPDCSQLVDTLAIAMALAVEAARSDAARSEIRGAPADALPHGAAGGAAQSEPASAAMVAADAVAGAEPDAALPEGAAAHVVPRASLWLTGDVGSLPSPALGASVGIELGWPSVQLRALGTLWFEQEAQLGAEGSALGGEVNLAQGALMACTSPLSARAVDMSVSVCGGGEVGRLSGRGMGVSEPRLGATLWLAPRVDAGIFWQLPDSRLRLGAQLGLVVPLVRDELVLDRLGVVHQPASLVGRAAFGADLAFE